MIDPVLAADAKKFIGQFANMVKYIQTLADANPDLQELATLDFQIATKKEDLAKAVEALDGTLAEHEGIAQELAAAADQVIAAHEEAARIKALGVKAGADALAKAQDDAAAVKAKLALDLEALQKAADVKLDATNLEIAAAQADLTTLKDEINRLRTKFNG